MHAQLNAQAHILNAIFQSHSLKYFDFENQRQDAHSLKHAKPLADRVYQLIDFGF